MLTLTQHHMQYLILVIRDSMTGTMMNTSGFLLTLIQLVLQQEQNLQMMLGGHQLVLTEDLLIT